eukprot:Gb_39343 [translate_table: standard]
MSSGSPCGACKFLRRKCISGCIFAPYFGSEQGVARFAAVHKVFGASNVSKLLSHVPVHKRHEAVVTVCYEAQARLSDPVYGCVATIFELQQQVGALQVELAMVQTQLANTRFVIINTLHQQQCYDAGVMQPPAYDNNLCSTITATTMTQLPNSSLSIASSYNPPNYTKKESKFHAIPYELDLSTTIDNISTTHPIEAYPEDESNIDPTEMDMQSFYPPFLWRK